MTQRAAAKGDPYEALYHVALNTLDERFHFHGLRHTCASLLLANGESVNVVAEQLGHDPAMTLRVYAHALPGAHREAVDRLEAIIRDAG